MELLENTGINKHDIKLIKEKQLLYGPIHTLSQVELETLQAYIKTHLQTGLIQSFTSLLSTHIFFKKKFGNSFYLCIDY